MTEEEDNLANLQHHQDQNPQMTKGTPGK